MALVYTRAKSQRRAPLPRVAEGPWRHSLCPVEFSKELRQRVLSGDITLSYRLWQRPKVTVGRRYRVGHGEIEVDSVDLLPFSAITEKDVRQSGEQDKESLRQRAAHSGPIDEDTLLYRVEFHPARSD